MSIALPFGMSVLQFCGLLLFAFSAGFIDSIAGGGGLIQLPALLNILPNVPTATLLAVNKNSSLLGTATAAIEYGRKLKSNWKIFLPAAIAAFFSSGLGAYVATRTNSGFLRRLVIILLAGMILFTLFKKDVGTRETESRFNEKTQMLLGALMGLVIGFYDGFFGPGTGSFLIMGIIFISGRDFLHASAISKIINVATNIPALMIYTLMGVGNLPLGCLMGGFNLFGAKCGVKLAVLKGSRFVRYLFLLISVCLLVKQLLG